MNQSMVIKDILFHKPFNDLESLCFHVDRINESKSTDINSLGLIDLKFLEEIKKLSLSGETIFFGKTLKDIKYIFNQEGVTKNIEVGIKYKDFGKVVLEDIPVPYSSILDQEFNSLEEVINLFKSHISSLAGYLCELENIDKFCPIVEPTHPTFKDDYRRILLDERTWLHLEVSQTGVASNIHLLGQTELWQEKLQAGLLNWNHDKDIVENIIAIFDIGQFPSLPRSFKCLVKENEAQESKVIPICSICMCDTLPDNPSLPQPLCNNIVCGVYYHRNCLYQWLVACAGGRPPAFGVITGSCPTCLQPVTCNENDD